MLIHVVNSGNNIYGREEISEIFGKEELERKCQSTDEIWYFYYGDGLEGYGYLMARKEDKFEIFSLSHCSCFGPLDQDFDFEGRSLKDLFDHCSIELQERALFIFESAGLNR